jgi:large-conductance mechanosensitive channel
MFKELKEFALKGNVVDTAVGIVLGEIRDVLKAK